MNETCRICRPVPEYHLKKDCYVDAEKMTVSKRSILCAQDFYPSTFDHSARDFSRTKLKKAYMSSASFRKSKSRTLQSRDEDFKSERQTKAHTQNETSRRDLRDSRDPYDQSSGAKEPIIRLPEHVLVSRPRTGRKPITSLQNMREKIKRIDKEHRLSLQGQTNYHQT